MPFAHLDGHPYAVPLALLSSVIVSALAGELAYRLLERPVTQWFKGRRHTAVPANA
jgi:peptidoglycan/LPS O-acetylase OafA/YrhL